LFIDRQFSINSPLLDYDIFKNRILLAVFMIFCGKTNLRDPNLAKKNIKRRRSTHFQEEIQNQICQGKKKEKKGERPSARAARANKHIQSSRLF